MPIVRPLHVALALSGAVTCLMAGVLVGILVGGGHVSHALEVITGPPSPARAGAPGDPRTVTATVLRTARARSARTVTVTRAAPASTVTGPASTATTTVTVSAPASTVTTTVTATQPTSSAGSSTP